MDKNDVVITVNGISNWICDIQVETEKARCIEKGLCEYFTEYNSEKDETSILLCFEHYRTAESILCDYLFNIEKQLKELQGYLETIVGNIKKVNESNSVKVANTKEEGIQ